MQHRVCLLSAPGIGEGSSTSETPQPPRKKRARVDPTVESVRMSGSQDLWWKRGRLLCSDTQPAVLCPGVAA